MGDNKWFLCRKHAARTASFARNSTLRLRWAKPDQTIWTMVVWYSSRCLPKKTISRNRPWLWPYCAWEPGMKVSTSVKTNGFGFWFMVHMLCSENRLRRTSKQLFCTRIGGKSHPKKPLFILELRLSFHRCPSNASYPYNAQISESHQVKFSFFI